MNRAYKLVWNTVSNTWTVASELARGRKKSSSSALRLAMLTVAALGVGHASAMTGALLPSGESVASGTATFDRNVTNQLTVNQSSSKLITNWASFDVGSNGKVVFAQPDASSIALNRVTGGSATQILGQVSANGQLIIVNPSGISFGAGSQVSAASIIGSVLDITDSDFNSGNLLFSRGAATGSIDNKGSLTAIAGSVSLLAPTVKNSGTINATGGNASLINADAVNVTTVDPSISSASTITGLIQHSGSITATQVSSLGGKILLTGDTSQAASQIQLAGSLQVDQTLVNGRSIVVNGDLNLNGSANALDLTSTDGYRLTNGAALNLNGASSGFSVNGTAYTVIRDVTQLQAMNTGLSGKYVLAGNIDASATSGWNAGAGFVPVGDYINGFTGVLDGLGHAVSQLTINRPSTSYVALIGYGLNSTVRNIGLLNHVISGKDDTAALLGAQQASNGNASVSNSYAIGRIVSTGSYVGGLVGVSNASNGTASISGSYSAGSLQATQSQIGGLIGINSSGRNGTASITDSYSTVNISNGSVVGGLVGYNQTYGGTAIISNSYAAGSMSSVKAAGGLVGYNQSIAGGIATLSNSYWNTETTGCAAAVAQNFSGTLLNLTGLTTAQSTQLASYANWGNSIDAQAGTGTTWRVYEGNSGPLLRNFLKPLSSVVVNNASKTYDGAAFSSAGVTFTTTTDPGVDTSKLFATVVGDGRNAGTYMLDAYSNQQGYDFTPNSGTLTINKRLLTISATDASKEYDGKLTSTGKPVVTGRQRGDSIVGLTQSYLDKNAGTGKTINVDAGYTIRDGNGGNNYDVVIVNSNAGVITPKALTISTVANSKIYDGGVTSANKPVVTGLLNGDRVTGLFQQYETKTVGTGKKLLVKAGYVVSDGNGGNNYTVTEQGSMDGVITVN